MNKNQSGINSNVVNLSELIDRISTFGAKYNPVRNDFTIPALTELKASGETLVAVTKTAENVDNNATAARSMSFKGSDGLITRASNAFNISGASEQSIQQAESKVRTYRSIRASEKPTAEEIAAAKADGKELRTNVNHNSSFDRKIENMADFIDFLSNSPYYGPNETDISVAGLTAKLTELKNHNSICSRTAADLDAARLVRDTMLFTDITGLVDIAMGVKKYVKSAFGANSIQYKSISKIGFRKYKKITTLETVEVPTPD
ncbi:MAG: hypothetical protein K0M40_21585 [Prolixibacteraceae bacterium]|nr:hypothetical protein [Prolixibacteraceae bacterium]